MKYKEFEFIRAGILKAFEDREHLYKNAYDFADDYYETTEYLKKLFETVENKPGGWELLWIYV